MHGKAAHLQAKPDHTYLRAHQLAAGRLRDETGIRPIAALQRRERADAGALLLDDGLKMDTRGRPEAGSPDRVEGIERANGARLHVAGAASIHLAVADNRRKGRRLPHVQRTGRNDVAMALHDQRPSRVTRRPIGADDGARLGKIMFDRPKAAQILQIVDVDMPIVDLVGALAQEIGDHILAWSLRAPYRGYRDQVPRGGELGFKSGVDGIENALGFAGFHCCFLLVWQRMLESDHQLCQTACAPFRITVSCLH